MIEGIAIAAYAVGAGKAYVYLRSEYAHLAGLLVNAIAQVKQKGWLRGADSLWRSRCGSAPADTSVAKRRP